MSTLFVLFLSLAGLVQSPAPAPAPPPLTSRELNALIQAVDKKFDAMKDFSAKFVQISNSVNRRQVDEGHLYLTSDKKMRFEYQTPEKKLWVSNGKISYSYNLRSREVVREKVKESTADLIPLMFMVGNANLRNKFKDIKELPIKPLVEGDRVLKLSPQRKLEGVQSINIEVNPRTNLIDRMVLLDTDNSSNEFIFMEIVINSKLSPDLFEFQPPAGIHVVEGSVLQ